MAEEVFVVRCFLGSYRVGMIQENVSPQNLPPPFLINPTTLIKNPFSPFYSALLILFTIFNHGNIRCINTYGCVLINQYSTGLFVSYSVGRKSHQTVCQSAQKPVRRKTQLNENTLSVIVLSPIVLSVIMLSIFMLGPDSQNFFFFVTYEWSLSICSWQVFQMLQDFFTPVSYEFL